MATGFYFIYFIRFDRQGQYLRKSCVPGEFYEVIEIDECTLNAIEIYLCKLIFRVTVIDLNSKLLNCLKTHF